MSETTAIGRYHVVRRLGQGGMGVVYLARDPIIERLVAIKLLKEGKEDPQLLERFVREARSAGRLRHPNVVTIFDVGDHLGQPFIAMEYVPGETLADLIRRRAPLALVRKLRYMELVCAGLAYAHKAGIVHRDVKPANVIVDAEGGLKILDFGIARLGASSMTQKGILVGTLNYMAPEQVAGTPVDHRSDVFAVGALSYELMSYQQAFSGSLEDGILFKVLSADPTPLAQLCPGLTPDLERIVARMLEKDPDRRYQDLNTAEQEIARARQQVESAEPVPDDGRQAAGEARPARAATSTPRRGTDREMLARRRLAQIEASIEAARGALEAGNLDAAIEAGEQAITLDPNNERAIDLLDRAHALIEAESIAARERLARGAIEAARREFEAGMHVAAIARLEAVSPPHDLISHALAELRAELDRLERERVQAETLVAFPGPLVGERAVPAPPGEGVSIWLALVRALEPARLKRWVTWPSVAALGTGLLVLMIVVMLASRRSPGPPASGQPGESPRTPAIEDQGGGAAPPPLEIRPALPGLRGNSASPVSLPGGPAPAPNAPRAQARRSAEAPSRLAQGAQRLQRGEYEEAIRAYQAVLDLDPNSTEGLQGIARARRAKEAERRLQQRGQLLQILARADESFEGGRYDAAVADYKAVLAVDPANARALDGVARAERAKAAEEKLSLRRKPPDPS